MIPQEYTGDMMKGKKVKVDREIRNRAGAGVTPGTVAVITNVVRGRGLSIKTEPCPHCGMFAYITGVSRNDVTLIEGLEQEG